MLLFFALQQTPFYANAQTTENTGWLVLQYEQKLSEKVSAAADIQWRSSHAFTYLQTILIRPYLSYAINDKQAVAAGYTYFGTWEREEGKKVFELEHRIWQHFQLEGKVKQVEVTNRLRLEQRFLKDAVFAQRLRYYIRGQLPIVANKNFTKGLFLGLQDEIFLNIQNRKAVNNSFFDQNRAFTGLGYRFNEVIDIEAGYMYRYQVEEVNKVHNHLFQLKVDTKF